jgi:site-specific DNA-methyltransferase (adenine-specific)
VTPYYSEGGITIYHGDCAEIAPHAWFGVDLLLTDPPYGLGKRMSGGTWGREERYGEMWRWDVAPDTAFLQSLIATSRNSIVWGGNYFGLPPSRCWLSWSKTNAVHTMASMELAWTSLDRPAKEWRGPVSTHDTGHPTQKPLRLIEWCIGLVPDAQTILDPYAGSGTTGLAAKNLGKTAILIEREERYCEIAAKRLAQGVLPMEQSA